MVIFKDEYDNYTPAKMKLTIEFDGDTVTVTDGLNFDATVFERITNPKKQAFVALAHFFGYEPAYLLNFDDEEEF